MSDVALQEDGFRLLLEDSYFLLLEQSSDPFPFTDIGAGDEKRRSIYFKRNLKNKRDKQREIERLQRELMYKNL